MRAEVAVQIVDDLIHDFEELEFLEKFQNLLDALQEQTNSPSAENQKLVRDSRDELIDALALSQFNRYPVSLQLPLQEMEIAEFLPAALARKIEREFAGNDLTPAGVRDGITKIRDNAARLLENSRKLSESTEFFEIYSDTYSDEEYAFSITIPRSAVNNELDDFGRELTKIDKLLGVFVEMATGSREDFKIISISSTDLTVVLESAPVVAVAIATALERVIAIYEKILTVVKLTKEMRAANSPEKAVLEMESHIRKSVRAEIELVAKEFERKYLKRTEAARKNELKTELRNCLREISSRVDQGYIFDVQGPDEEESPEEEGSTVEENSPRWQRRLVQGVREKLKYFRIEDEPILGLPRPDDGETTESDPPNITS